MRTQSSYFLKFVVILLAAFCWVGTVAHAYLNGPPVSSTGAPALGRFPKEEHCTDCHTGTVNSGNAEITLTPSVASYAPNQLIQLMVTVKQAGRAAFGFQATALDAEGRFVGQWVLTDPLRTSIEQVTSDVFNGRSYIQHTRTGVTPTASETGSWTLGWRAPLQASGRVTFYVSLNAANNNRGTGGDSIYARSLSLEPASTLPSVSVVSAASFVAARPFAPQSIVALFGSDLSNLVGVATTRPLPLTLGGAEVVIRDARGVEHLAPLFFVTPQQINLLVPAGVSEGPATFTVRLQGVGVAQGTFQIEPVAPAFFSANVDGKGVAAGVAIRVKAEGAQSLEPLARLNPTTQRYEPLPLELGAAEEQLFLAVFGSGFRAQTAFDCRIDGERAEVFYAGAQGQLEGLDQVNLRLPRTLAGRGQVNLLCQANGQAANVVTISVK